MASLEDICEAWAGQISTALDPLIDDLQVIAIGPDPDPTPPSIDIYPADPFQEGLAFGKAENDMRFVVRARVTIADQDGGRKLLLSMMDPNATTSLAKAITNDRTLGSTVSNLAVESLTGYGVFLDAGGQGSLLGCTWTVRVFP